MLFPLLAAASTEAWTVRGVVMDEKTGEPLQGAVVNLDALWCVSAADGSFSIPGVQTGKYGLEVKLLGYADYSLQITVRKDIPVFMIKLKESSLALKEVVVTASRPYDGTGTTHNIGRDALNHLQLSNITDMAALLPGGKTVNPDLTAAKSFSVRSAGTTSGSAAFATAVEVDGVRLGTNAGFGELAGVDTRNISVDNIESVEVVSGVASAEYGDLGSGMVKIHTKHGRTPLNINFSVNPRTFQTSVSKGMGLGTGVLNVSGEWANATKKIVSPYESYTRRGLSLAYSNTFAKVLMFEAGLSGNLGGMNSEDDPDAFSGEYTRVKDNVIRGNVSLSWLVNKPGITSLKLNASANYNDNKSHFHGYNSSASSLPAVHNAGAGYMLADRLPLKYYSDQIVDSRELDLAASLKYNWIRRFSGYKSALKAGVQWKADGNAGEGEYYEDASLAANGYRPRPYSQYPFMHTLSLYAEEDFAFPFNLQLTAGVRMDNVFVKGSSYRDVSSFSPRFNAKWSPRRNLSFHAGWGISEKLPSFYVLYPKQEYRDILTYSFSHGDSSSYVYYTQPYAILENPSLKWQSNMNSEIGADFSFAGFKVAVAGYWNIVRNPYKYTTTYTPFSYRISGTPAGYVIPDNPQIRVDGVTGEVSLRGSDSDPWTIIPEKLTNTTFIRNTTPDNGAPITSAGVELTVDFPVIKPIRTSLRLDASYTYTDYTDDSISYHYNNGWSHTTLPDRSYQYVGLYRNGSGTSSLVCGETSRRLNANLTSITHIPEMRIIITCRLELSLLTRTLNHPYGDNVSELWPVEYMTADGNFHRFIASDAYNPEFSNLILKNTNEFLFLEDGYGPYASANLSITKEIGKHVSLSFFANNFTNSRPAVASIATGVQAILTPDFYYGLTCRIKL